MGGLYPSFTATGEIALKTTVTKTFDHWLTVTLDVTHVKRLFSSSITTSLRGAAPRRVPLEAHVRQSFPFFCKS